MADNLSDIGEAIRKASEAYAEAIAAVSKALQNIAAQAGGGDRDRLIENWLRVARMSKDGMITAIEQAYEFWEREVRRTATGNPSATRSNPMDALAENWRKATRGFRQWQLERRSSQTGSKRAENFERWGPRVATYLGAGEEIKGAFQQSPGQHLANCRKQPPDAFDGNAPLRGAWLTLLR